MSSIPTLLNLRPPINDTIVGPITGPDNKTVVSPGANITPIWSDFFTNLNRTLVDLAVFNPANYGAAGNGIADDTRAVQAAINNAVQAGGGIVQLDSGTFSVTSLSTPTGNTPIVFQGEGLTTIIIRRGQLPAGVGLFDIKGSNVSFTDLLIDGNTLVSVGLQYNVGFNGVGGNDPMAASLTTNTSVWVHGPASMLLFQRVTFQHAGGYSILLDATAQSISYVDVINCWFINNRPTLFGVTAGALIYGSWNGGILAKGNGTTAGSSVVNGLTVTLCRFLRNTGNCLWSHNYGLNELNTDFRFIGNYFLDCGLDAIEVGVVTGGVVAANVFRRVGYICMSDTSISVPRWLANLNATALDSAGVVKGVPYTDNSFLSVNGGCMDLDGHGDSAITGNVCRIPFVGEPEYVEDQIAITGSSNSGSQSYGVNLGNTAQTPYGGQYVNINGNTFINLSGGAMRMYSARNCAARSNLIVSPPVPMSPPITFGPVGTNQYQRCYSLRISGNDIYYSPTMGAPAVFEDDSITDFLSTEVNYVYDNFPISTTGLAFEFQKSTHSGSFVSSIFPPTQNYIATESGANGAIACAAGSGAKLTVGLTVEILLAHTLSGGAANTFAYNGGAALAIVSHLNVANNIANGYAVGSVVSLLYDGTRWQDLSQ